MKQHLTLLIISLILFGSCKGGSKQAEVNGEIKGLTTDTIYLYANDELSDFIAPIPVKENKFSWTTDMDTTLIQAILFIDNETQYPVYLERGETIRIKLDLNTPGTFEATGSPANEAFTAFYKELYPPSNPNDTLSGRNDTLPEVRAEQYIRHHQNSIINIYLLDKYFVQQSSPNLAKIKELIGYMDGWLQDKPYIRKLNEEITQNEMVKETQIAPSFTLTNAEGKRLTRTSFRDRYLLLAFWASWSDSCKQTNGELKKIYKQYPPKTERERERENRRMKNDRTLRRTPELAIAGISLDMDQNKWKESIEEDTLKWEQLNDFAGWSSTVVKQYAVNEIPYNILIDNQGRIIARGIKGKELSHTLDSLLKRNK